MLFKKLLPTPLCWHTACAWDGMRAEAELLIGRALKQQWPSLRKRAVELTREKVRSEHDVSVSDIIEFEQLIEGCLFTFRYTAGRTPALSVLGTKLTDHKLN